MYSDKFIKEIPKTDLHVHLDGSLRLESLIEMSKKDNIELPSYTKEGLKKFVFKDTYNSLVEYLHGFMYTCAILRNPEHLERSAYELAIDNQKEGVRYLEARLAPQLLMDNKKITMETVFKAVNDGLKRAENEFNSRKAVREHKEPPFRYGIIACAMRMFGKANFSPYYTRLFSVHKYSTPADVIKMGALELSKAVVKIRDEEGIPIVGFDLAGQEDGYPAEHFWHAYNYAHHHFMHKTVHAGEAYGAESIFQAITHLNADRLGHCYYLFDVKRIVDPEIIDKNEYIKKLSSFIAEQRVTIEVCLTSNYQTNPDLTNIKDHTFGEMLKHNISTTFCTDNRLISNTTVSKEIKLALNNFKISPYALKNLLIYGFKRSFYPGPYTEKRKYVRQMKQYFDSLAKKHGVFKKKTNVQ